MARLVEKQCAIDAGLASLRSFALPNAEWASRGFEVKANGELRTAEQVLRVPRAELDVVERAMGEAPHGWRGGATPPAEGSTVQLPALGREAVEISVKYSNYLERQEREVERVRANGRASIPAGFDFRLPCLSVEEVEKLSSTRPATLLEASQIPGITPKALLYIYNQLQRGGGGGGAKHSKAKIDLKSLGEPDRADAPA